MIAFLIEGIRSGIGFTLSTTGTGRLEGAYQVNAERPPGSATRKEVLLSPSEEAYDGEVPTLTRAHAFFLIGSREKREAACRGAK
jgi:hypothetical protein